MNVDLAELDEPVAESVHEEEVFNAGEGLPPADYSAIPVKQQDVVDLGRTLHRQQILASEVAVLSDQEVAIFVEKFPPVFGDSMEAVPRTR